MSFVVVGYPEFSDADSEYIQGVREKYDVRLFKVVKPHVTFVFPTEKLSAKELTEHVAAKAKDFTIINILFDSVKTVEDHSKTYTHAFLIPSNGYAAIEQLHEALYTGELLSELRSDIPFTPHLGIGNDANEQVMLRLAEQINAGGIRIKGSIKTLTIAEFDGSKVTDIEQVPL